MAEKGWVCSIVMKCSINCPVKRWRGRCHQCPWFPRLHQRMVNRWCYWKLSWVITRIYSKVTDNEGCYWCYGCYWHFSPKITDMGKSDMEEYLPIPSPVLRFGQDDGWALPRLFHARDVHVGLCLLRGLCTAKEKQKALERGECPSNASNAMQKICLLLVRTFHSPIANNQVNAELINEFLVVKSQTKIDFGKFHRIARFVLA